MFLVCRYAVLPQCGSIAIHAFAYVRNGRVPPKESYAAMTCFKKMLGGQIAGLGIVVSNEILMRGRNGKCPLKNNVGNCVPSQQICTTFTGCGRAQYASIYSLNNQTFQNGRFLLWILIAVAQHHYISLASGDRYDFNAHAREEGIAELGNDDGQDSSALSLDAARGSILDIADLGCGGQNAFTEFGPNVAFDVAEDVGHRGDRCLGFDSYVLDGCCSTGS